MEPQFPSNGYVLGLDVGSARIGTALASVIARLPQPFNEITAGPDAFDQIQKIVATNDVQLVVVGLPRNLDGEETNQTVSIKTFTRDLKQAINAPVVFVDESLSTVRAAELMKNNEFKNVSEDSLAACFILEEFFATMFKMEDGEL